MHEPRWATNSASHELAVVLAGSAMTAAAAIAFNSERAAAVLIGQRLIGTKSFDK